MPGGVRGGNRKEPSYSIGGELPGRVLEYRSIILPIGELALMHADRRHSHFHHRDAGPACSVSWKMFKSGLSECSPRSSSLLWNRGLLVVGLFYKSVQLDQETVLWISEWATTAFPPKYLLMPRNFRLRFPETTH